MLELDRKVLGNITTKEIIGAEPPENEIKESLEKELAMLLEDIKSQTKENLQKILDEQKSAQAHVDSRPGAMALAQNKIQLYIEYNQKYLEAIKENLKS